MKAPDAVLVVELLPEVLEALLGLLESLSPAEWDAPTVCGAWTVRDVALHLLGDDVGNLSRRRDDFLLGSAVKGWDDLVAFINNWNELWVQAGRRMSGRLLRDLLGYVGRQVCEYFRSLDLDVLGDPVVWAGPEPAPVWLDVAREYTERWLHQQHIRDAVGKPGLTQPRFLSPVLATFVHALPRTYAQVSAPDGTLVALTISGPAGGRWFLLREGGKWTLCIDVDGVPDAEAILPADVAWRVFTKGIARNEAVSYLTLRGDRALAATVLDAVSIIA